MTTLKEEAKEYPGFLEDAESFFDKMRLGNAFLVNTSEEDKQKLFAIADKVLANKPIPVVAATSIVNAMTSFPRSSGRTKTIIIEDLKDMNIINIDDLKKMSLKDIMKGFKSRNTARKEHPQKTPFVDFDNNAEVTKDFRNWRSKVTNPAAFVDNVKSDFANDLKAILVDHGILLPFIKANNLSNCLIEDIVDVKEYMEKGTISDGHITTMLQESALIQYSWSSRSLRSTIEEPQQHNPQTTTHVLPNATHCANPKLDNHHCQQHSQQPSHKAKKITGTNFTTTN